jgi:16S rRNA (guanine527-N7)-methyltransferase
MFSTLKTDNKNFVEKFEVYFNELVDYNTKVNLTAITDKQDVYIKHFFDSCLASEFIPTNAKVADIGTGAGFPGVPLKIIRNDINLNLVDSLNKRITFLNYMQQKLGIKYNTYHSRAEEFCANSRNRESFDVVVSRAVAKLNTLAEYCLPLVKVGGMFIAYKGGEIEQEVQESLNAIKILGGQVEAIKNFDLPMGKGSRTLVIIKKIKATPKGYPRGKNLPKLKPL